MVTATNGVPGDNSRLVWHLDLTGTSERVLTAESIYPDVPRLVVLLVLFILLGSGIVALSAGARRRYAKMRADKQAAAMTEV